MNLCVFIGRFTKDPELRYAPSGTAVGNFTLAVDRKFKKEDQPTADFLPMVTLGKTAETISKYFEKGNKIQVTTRVQNRNWEGTDGTKHYITEFVVEGFEFIESKSNKEGSNKPPEAEEDFVL